MNKITQWIAARLHVVAHIRGSYGQDVVTSILPRRDASGTEASEHLSWQEVSWPEQRQQRFTEGYAGSFRDGAVVFPSVLFRVQVVETGKLGFNTLTPLVESRRSGLEKRPWKDIPSLRKNIESDFLRPLYLGESIAPFRIFPSILAVVPWNLEKGSLLDSVEAQRCGYAYLGGWLADAERIWSEHGRGKRSLNEQLDYYGQLSAQFPIAPLRVVYSASGTLPADALLSDNRGIVEHKLYWIGVDSKQEGLYLLGILNSETARERGEHLQSRGQWGARDFDKVMLSLPIPKFDSSNRLHAALARATAHAEKVTAAVQLNEGMHFVSARQRIRTALREDGVAQEMDKLVAELLDVGTIKE